MSKTTLSFTLNAWSVEWDEDHRRRPTPCEVKAACKGEPTQGVATFMQNGQLVVVGTYVNPRCCKKCAIEHTTGQGMKGVVTITHIIRALTGTAN